MIFSAHSASTEKPEQQGKYDADKNTGRERKIKGEIFLLDNNVTGKSANPWDLSIKKKQPAYCGTNNAGNY
jgi:hypothetical protein